MSLIQKLTPYHLYALNAKNIDGSSGECAGEITSFEMCFLGTVIHNKPFYDTVTSHSCLNFFDLNAIWVFFFGVLLTIFQRS